MPMMTWAEFVAQAKAAGVRDDTPLDAIDCYSPQRGEPLSISVHGGTVVIQTQDVEDLARGRAILCVSCRAEAGPDPRPLAAAWKRRAWAGLSRLWGAAT